MQEAMSNGGCCAGSCYGITQWKHGHEENENWPVQLRQCGAQVERAAEQQTRDNTAIRNFGRRDPQGGDGNSTCKCRKRPHTAVVWGRLIDAGNLNEPHLDDGIKDIISVAFQMKDVPDSQPKIPSR